MANVASLGLAIDSSQVSAAIPKLNELAGAANNAAKGVDSFSQSAGAAANKSKDISTLAAQAGVSYQEMEARLRATKNAFDLMTKGANDNTAALAREIKAIQDAYGITDQLTKAQVRQIQALEDQYAKATLTGKGYAEYNAAVKAGVTSHSQAGDVIKGLAGKVYDAKKAQDQLTNSTNDNNSAFGGLANTLTRRVIFGLVVAQARQAVSAIIDLNAELAKTGDISSRNGLGSGITQGLAAAGAGKGVDTAKMLEAMLAFNGQVTLAKQGLGTLGTVLQYNGKSITDTRAALLDVADLVQRATGDYSKQSSILTQAGLPASREMVRVMEQGRDAILAQIEAAKKFSQEQLDAAQKLDDRWNVFWNDLKTGGKKAVLEIFDPKSWVVSIDPGSPIDRFWTYMKEQARNVNQGLAETLSKRTFLGGTPGDFVGGASPVGVITSSPLPAAAPAKPVVDPELLKQQMALESQRIGILGQTATVEQQVQLVENAIKTARLSNINILPKEAGNLKRLAEEQALGITQIKAQADAYLIQSGAIGKSVGDAAAYVAVQTQVLDAVRRGVPLSEQRIAQITKEAEAMGKLAQANALRSAQSSANFTGQTMFMSSSDLAAAQVMHNLYGDEWQSHMDDALAKQIKMNDLTKQVGDAAATLGNNLIQAFASGKSGLDAILPALSSFGSSLTSIGTDSLKSGISGMLKGLGTSGFDPASLGIGAAGIGVSLITNMLTQQEADAKAAAEAIQKAADRAQGYMDRIRKASIDTSTLLGELQSFDIDAERQRAEEAKNGTRNLALLEQTLATERTAIAEKGLKDAQKQFDALVQGAKSATTESVKSLTDATTSLATALTVLGKGIAGLSDDVAVAVAKLQSDFAAGLMDKINEAYGAGYLTQIASLIRQRSSDMSDAAKLGISPSLVDLAFKSQVQKTIDDAQLSGVAFQQVLAAFPQLTGQVHEFSAAAADTTTTLQQTITSLTDFMRKTSDFRKSLLVDNTLSTLSPADRLAEAQRQFRHTLSLANNGDATAQGNLQSAATTYLDQAKSFYASSTQYAAIFSEVQNSLLSAESAAQQQINYAAAQVSWLQQQTQIQQQQLNWLISLNTAVATLSSTIANPAATTPAAVEVNVAAVTAAEAAKTWHYPTVDPYLYGDKGDWTESHRALYRAEHPDARYQQGGLVSNGLWNQDSVRAPWLAGGEFVVSAPMVTAQTLPVLQSINSGRPGNDNGAPASGDGRYFSALGNTLVRAMAGISMTEITAIREDNAALRAAVDKLTRAVEANKPKDAPKGTRAYGT